MRRNEKTRRGPVDWAEVRRRLDAAAASAEGAFTISPERASAILAARARAIAVPPAADAAGAGPRLAAVTFSLADERYGIEARHVREVMRLTHLTPVPGASALLLGVTNLRGEVLPVFDLRQVFGLQVRGLSDLTRVLVLGQGGADLAILADAAHEVRRLREADLLEPPASLGAERRALVRGVTADGLILVDSAALLEDRRLFLQGDNA